LKAAHEFSAPGKLFGNFLLDLELAIAFFLTLTSRPRSLAEESGLILP